MENSKSIFTDIIRDRADKPLEFTYDSNGNMIADADREIKTIKYNLLNLPDTVQFANGSQIINRYSAKGQKLNTQYVTVEPGVIVPLLNIGDIYNWRQSGKPAGLSETEYVGNKEYQKEGKYNGTAVYTTNGLKRINNPEGYVDDANAYHYYTKDYLGNNREVWKIVGSTKLLVQRTQYYSSGLPWSEGTGASV